MGNTFSTHTIGRKRNAGGEMTENARLPCCLSGDGQERSWGCREWASRRHSPGSRPESACLCCVEESQPSLFWVSSAGPSRDLSVTLPPLEACSSLLLLRNEAEGIGLLGSGGHGGDAYEPGCTLRPGSSGKRASQGPIVDCVSWAHPRQGGGFPEESPHRLERKTGYYSRCCGHPRKTVRGMAPQKQGASPCPAKHYGLKKPSMPPLRTPQGTHGGAPALSLKEQKDFAGPRAWIGLRQGI